ncbi:hypothetical protein KUTeg_023945 [Tegillarca granosa]|uniref:Uncharacterized protein n=1 Tax=Tegillarca granosa TaxID=220873 RepID=A0ABQ9DWJ0_TEGGR|nr:hypothetical protein KUTeg_023945 [Tegillarca granosa]
MQPMKTKPKKRYPLTCIAVAEAWAADTWLIKSESEKAKAKASSRSVVDAVLDVTKGRPWLWAVFLVVVVLPIVLIIAYCCMSSSKKGILTTLKTAAEQYPWLWAQEFLDAQAKKTDEQSPDDESKSKTSDEKSDKDGAGGDSPDEPEDEDEEESSPAEAKTSDSPRNKRL